MAALTEPLCFLTSRAMETELKGTFLCCRLLHPQFHHSGSNQGTRFTGAGDSYMYHYFFFFGSNYDGAIQLLSCENKPGP